MFDRLGFGKSDEINLYEKNEEYKNNYLNL